MNGFILKQIKSIAYASAGGSIVIGTATVDLVDADAMTILFMVGAAVVFNMLKELYKIKVNGKKEQ